MKIIIAGGGEVGFYLAKLFEQDHNDITLIDSLQEKLSYVESNLGVYTILGDSTSYKTLMDAKIEETDLLLAVTSSESINITTSLIGKKLGAKKTIARISNMEYLIDKKILDLRELGIDDLISPESLAAREVKHLLLEPSVTETFDFEGGKFVLMGLQLDHNATIIGKTIALAVESLKNKNFMIVAILRKGETIVPNGNTRFEEGDHVYFIALEEGKNSVLEFSGKKPISIKNLLILGGSRTGAFIARRLSKHFNIKLIEKDKERCNELAKRLPNVLVIHGDGTDIKLLEEEGLVNFDAFVAVTGNSETNIFSCLMAKENGVKKTIALVENIGLFDLSFNMGIDTLINKKLAAANFIIRSVRKDETKNLNYLYGVNAEVLEFKVKPNSRIIKKSIKELKLPASTIISGVVRKGHGYITHGDFRFQANDVVTIFALPHGVKKLESYFA